METTNFSFFQRLKSANRRIWGLKINTLQFIFLIWTETETLILTTTVFLLTETYLIFHPSPSVEAEKRHYCMWDHYTVACVWMFRGHKSTINSQRRLFWSDPFPYRVDLNEMEPRQTPGRQVALLVRWEALITIDHICFFQTITQKSSLHANTFWSFLVSPTFLLQQTSSLILLHCHTRPFSTVDTKPVPRWTVVQYFQEVFVLQFLYLSRKYHLGLKSTDCIAAGTRLWACNC